MTREEFYRSVEKYIMGMLPEQFAECTPVLTERTNQGGKYMGMYLQSEEPNQIQPVINLDHLYSKYGDMEELDMIVAVSHDIVSIYKQITDAELQEMHHTAEQIFSDYEFAKSRLFIAPASVARRTSEEIGLCKYQEDLPMQCRVAVKDITTEDATVASIVVSEPLLQSWGKSFDEVYAAAEVNTAMITPTVIRPMTDFIAEFFDEFSDDMPDNGMILVTNHLNNNGAANLFLPGVMEQVADVVQGSYIVLPSSIHECIVLSLDRLDTPLDMDTVSNLEMMVQEINATQVELEDQLSDRAYFYDAETKIFGLAEKMVKEIRHDISQEKVMDSSEVAHHIVSDTFKPKS